MGFKMCEGQPMTTPSKFKRKRIPVVLKLSHKTRRYLQDLKKWREWSVK